MGHFENWEWFLFDLDSYFLFYFFRVSWKERFIHESREKGKDAETRIDFPLAKPRTILYKLVHDTAAAINW